VFYGDHNFEIKIGSKGWVSQALCEGGLGVGLGKGTCALPHAQDERLVYPGLSLPPVTLSPVYKSLWALVFPLSPFWGTGNGLQSLPCMASSLGCMPGPFYRLP
jgi:hypothetical protein